MNAQHPIAEKLPSNADHPAPTAWADARRRLEGGRWFWLATVRADGRPHVVPVLAVWLEDAAYFVAGDASRKAHNLAHDAHCVLTVAVDDAHLVVEGHASQVSSQTTLQQVADVYARKYEWRVRVRDGAFDADYGAPTAGPPPYHVYQLAPTKVFGFGTDETFSPTRWQF